MGVNIKDYRDVLVQDPKIDTTTNITYNVPEMRRHFKDAGQGKDVVTNELMGGLIGRDAVVTRTVPNAPAPYNDDEVRDILQRKMQLERGASLSIEQEEQLNRDIRNLSAKSGIDGNDFQKAFNSTTEINAYESRMVNSFWDSMKGRLDDSVKQSDRMIELGAKSEQGPLTPAEQTEIQTELDDYLRRFNQMTAAAKRETEDIAHLSIKRAEGNLLPVEQERLEESLNNFSKKYNIPRAQLDAHLNAFEEKVKPEYTEMQRKHGSNVLNRMDQLRENVGESYGNHFIVADYQNNDQAVYRFAHFDPDDLPSKRPPGTIDQWELVIAVHEARHYGQKNKMTQQSETDSSRAEYKLLTDMGAPKMKDYMQDLRMMWSFKYGSSEGLLHDSTTALRIEEQSKGRQQLDMNKFREEKMQLLNRINGKLENTENPKYGDLMGATRDVLREGNLTTAQRAEAEAFLESGARIGYKENPFYPKAKPQNAAELTQPDVAPAAPKPSVITPAA